MKNVTFFFKVFNYGYTGNWIYHGLYFSKICLLVENKLLIILYLFCFYIYGLTDGIPKSLSL